MINIINNTTDETIKLAMCKNLTRLLKYREIKSYDEKKQIID